MKKVIIAFALTLFGIGSNAQSIPEAGKPCPDFALSYVTHYPKKQVSLNDFKGAWLFLDFWFTGCSACIRSFPKVSELQKEFIGKVQFLLVGYEAKKSQSSRNTEEVFEKLRTKQGFEIAAAYDSVLAYSWGIQSMPHIVIIDPQGIVRYITDGIDMTREKIQGLLDGAEVSFKIKPNPGDKLLPDFVSNLTSEDGKIFPNKKILNHSVLTKWNGEEFQLEFSIDEYASRPDEGKEQGLKLSMVTLEMLYDLAYVGFVALKAWSNPLYGKFYPFPVIELKDKKAFEYKYDGTESRYNYNLSIPPSKATKENIMKYMQQDLERVFGYDAFVEERDMPVWKLVAKPGTEAKIKTKGGPLYYDAMEGKSIAAGFTVRNVAMKDYIMYLCFYLNEKEKHPYIDATGIKSNIDLTIDADLTNLEDVKKELQKQGLDIVQGTKKMKVLVIRNPKIAK